MTSRELFQAIGRFLTQPIGSSGDFTSASAVKADSVTGNPESHTYAALIRDLRDRNN